MARFELATLGGLAAGSVAGGFLWELIGPASFFLNAALYAVSWGIYRFLVDYHDPARVARAAVTADGLEATFRARFREAAARYGRLLGSSHVLLLAPTWIALNAAISTIGSFQIVFQLRGTQSAFADEQLLMRGFSAGEISTGLLIGMIVFVAGVLFWGNQFKRYRRTTIIAFSALAGLVGLVAALLANHAFGAPPIVFVVLALVGLGAVFVLAGGTPAALGLLADISESYEHDRGAIMGLYSVFLAIGQIVGQSLAGVAAELRGIDGLLALTFVLVLVALAPLYSLRLYEHRIGGEVPGAVPHPRPAGSAEL
jgi:MFS family permease